MQLHGRLRARSTDGTLEESEQLIHSIRESSASESHCGTDFVVNRSLSMHETFDSPQYPESLHSTHSPLIDVLVDGERQLPIELYGSCQSLHSTGQVISPSPVSDPRAFDGSREEPVSTHTHTHTLSLSLSSAAAATREDGWSSSGNDRQQGRRL